MSLLDPGTLVGELLQDTYEVKELVGEGGMAYVYRARHRVLQGDVALKVLQRKYASRDEFRERFLREARLQYQLQHPNVVRVLDFLEDRGLVGCVLEWCNAGELSRHHYPYSSPQSYISLRKYFFPLLNAMEHVHSQGYVHRDIKPANILLHQHNQHTQWKLNDFGLLKDPGADALTQSGAIVGTFYYISPEQFQESREVDCRTDIYGLGVVLYQMLLGKVPFSATMPRLAMQILESEPEFPDDFPPSLKAVLLKTLAKKPEERFASCLALRNALSVVFEELETTLIQPPAASEVGNEMPGEPPDSSSNPVFEMTFEGTATSGVSASSESFMAVTAHSAMVPPRQELPSANSVPVPPDNSFVHERLPSSPVERAEVLEAPVSKKTKKSPSSRLRRILAGVALLCLLSVVGWGMGLYVNATPVASLPDTSKPGKLSPSQKQQIHKMYMKFVLNRARSFALKGDWGQTRYYLRQTCKHLPKNCYWYALWTHQTVSILKQACESKDKVACYWHKVGKKRKWTSLRFLKKAVHFYEKSCKAGEHRACHLLGTKVPFLSQKQRERWLVLSCEKKSGKACLLLGNLVGRSELEAIREYKKACDLYISEGCRKWGERLKESSGENARKKALQAFRKGCQMHDARSCRLAQGLSLDAP